MRLWRTALKQRELALLGEKHEDKIDTVNKAVEDSGTEQFALLGEKIKTILMLPVRLRRTAPKQRELALLGHKHEDKIETVTKAVEDGGRTEQFALLGEKKKDKRKHIKDKNLNVVSKYK